MKFRLVHIFHLILITSLPFQLISCSTIKAAWYSQPDREYRKTATIGTSALFVTERIENEIGSSTNPIPVMYGPALLPVIPEDQPSLDSANIELVWDIRPLKGREKVINPEVKLSFDLDSLFLITDDGEKHLPSSISVRRDQPDKDGNHLEYWGSYTRETWPKEYRFQGDQSVRISYDVIYSQNEWHEFKPIVRFDGKNIDIPAIRFKSKRDYQFNACVVPFMFAPVR